MYQIMLVEDEMLVRGVHGAEHKLGKVRLCAAPCI